MECTQLSLFGKMYQERSVPTAERTSAPFWKNLPAWNSQTLLFLDLRGGQMEQSRSNRRSRMEPCLAIARRSTLGSPQRRKRIALVADFGGQRASEILFERTGVSGHPDEGIPTWKEITRLTANCPAGNDRVVAGAERSLHLENTFGMRRRRQGCAGADGENRDVIDATRPDALPAGLLSSGKYN